ncbi:capsule biosynthesis GfcC family protein [Luteimonas sp. S4-F44]|uniref:capsule biosynthesis GfcC family protein n=1 Tax=Luteimonas sp. S4-F44 TaxID=2925842 RepID=UPI001F52C68C|nr:capsule biosynthesis GfcC family protein [Luteimonas sp. S4-F44]UNK42209.1 capsule biosynthesis GfcC family protein [Luteimonas sp. S4-F44]
MKRIPLCLALLTASVAQAESGTLQVRVDGAVQRPADYQVPTGTRLADVLLAAMPTDAAYTTGAALLRPSALEAQTRLKAGVLHDLQAVQAGANVPSSTIATAARLETELAALPVTGRVNNELDARVVEVRPEANLVLRPGDRITYPTRPADVRVTGAVVATCTLPHVPLRDAVDYLRDCPVAGADRDLLFAVQPDGTVQMLGIAGWNRSPRQALAPGATLYVPLPERDLHRAGAPDLNRELAAFLATQPLPSLPAHAPDTSNTDPAP